MGYDRLTIAAHRVFGRDLIHESPAARRHVILHTRDRM